MDDEPRASLPTSSRRLISIGAKLATATALLMLVVTGAVYVNLTAYQRESMLRAKEMSGSAVTRLFADSVAAAVVFNDEESLGDELKNLAHDPEVENVAVWAVGANGQVERRLGELKRGAPDPVPVLAASLEVQRQPNRVVVVSPVRDTEGKAVAVASVGLSLEQENAAIARMQTNTLYISGGVALGLTLLLIGFVRFAIGRPLGKLVVAAKQLEEGKAAEVNVRSRDEIGVLASAFRSMAVAIRSREERINARNRDMRLVLDNVGQGFISIDANGKLSDERSRVLDEWFDAPAPGMAFTEYLERIDATQAEWFGLGWSSIKEGFLPIEVCLDQLPKVLVKETLTFELAYRPILRGEQIDKLVVVITDVTERVERERAEQAQREAMSIFQRLLADRTAFDEFFAEAKGLVQAVVESDASGLLLLKRQVHTLKGICALYGLQRISNLCHAIEENLDAVGAGISDRQRETLQGLWADVTAIRTQVGGDNDHIEVERQEYESFLSNLTRSVDDGMLIGSCMSWRYESAAKRLGVLSGHIKSLGGRLGKPDIDVVCEPTRLRLPPTKWSEFWVAFSHVVRNAVDHGVETVDARRAAGKRARALVALSITQESQYVVVTVGDDGPGIDWPKVANSAAARGMPHETQADLEQALFAQGVSTREEVTATSGRGVGLNAIRDVVQRLGGRVEIQTDPGRGTTFRFILPQNMLGEEVVAQTSQRPRPLRTATA